MNKRKKKSELEEDQVVKEKKSPSIILFHYGNTTVIEKIDLKKFMKNRFMAIQRTMPLFNEEIERKWTGPFRFLVIADPMLGLRKFLGQKHLDIWRLIPSKTEETVGKMVLKDDKDILDEAIHLIDQIQPKPRFVAFIGNRFFTKKNPEQSEIETQDFYSKYFFNAISRISEDINVLCVRGEHESSLENYKSEFGHSFYSFRCSGILFLVLDTSLFWSQNTPEASEQRIWFESQLVWARDRWRCRIIILQHRPWHSAPISEDLRKSWLHLFESSGVVAVLSGFILRKSSYTHGPTSHIITTSICAPLGLDPPGICTVDVNRSEVTHSFVPLNMYYNRHPDGEFEEWSGEFTNSFTVDISSTNSKFSSSN